jgi:hypothetical protein
MFACLLAVHDRMNRFTADLVCLILDSRKRTKKNQSSGESVLSSILTEGSSCCSETKHYRRMVVKPKMASIPNEDGFCSSETNRDRKMAQKKNTTVRFGKITSTWVTNSKTVLGSNLGEGAGFKNEDDVNFLDNIQ